MTVLQGSGLTNAEGTVHFTFAGAASLYACDGVYAADVVGQAPMPEICPGDRLLLPVDEGIAITADREYISGEFDCQRIGGSFCSREGTLDMLLVQREGAFLLIALDSGIYASYQAVWDADKGLYIPSIHCGKPCRVRYGIFTLLKDACQFYRQTRPEPLTLQEKCQRTPAVETLVGGGIFWIWNNNYDKVMYADTDTDLAPETGEDLLTVAKELHDGGVRKAMIGLFFDKDSAYVEELYKRFGYICTQYDNYNDVFDPALLTIVPNNRVKNCGYTHRRMKDHPDGVLVNPDGSLATAWALKGFDGQMHDQNRCCSKVAAERMREEIPAILAEYPTYKGRFIDVYGTGLDACYSDAHPYTREESLTIKKGAFQSLREMGLVVGTEDGFAGLMDELDYVEGLHSPVYFRNRNSGRNHANMYTPAQEAHIQKQMLDPACRVPLWHLVYHECMLAFPYWGDSTEMSPELVQNKILFACLYGCPPLYSFSVGDFPLLKEPILQSYCQITAVHEKVATLPMTDFAVLTEDYKVQRSVFGDRYEVVVNFSDVPYLYEDTTIPPKDMLFGEVRS